MKFIILSSFLLIFSFCKNQTPVPVVPETTSEASAEQLSSEFLKFYEKFHQDSIFQMEHIGWPLSGQVPPPTDSSRMTKVATAWQREKWLMHHPIDLSTGEFEREWKTMGDFLIIERVKHKQTGLTMERRFSKDSDGNWSLIYYSEL